MCEGSSGEREDQREEFEALFDAYPVNNADAQADGAAQTEANADGETAAEQPEEQA